MPATGFTKLLQLAAPQTSARQAKSNVPDVLQANLQPNASQAHPEKKQDERVAFESMRLETRNTYRRI